jgi:hypothetical protein
LAINRLIAYTHQSPSAPSPRTSSSTPGASFRLDELECWLELVDALVKTTSDLSSSIDDATSHPLLTPEALDGKADAT